MADNERGEMARKLVEELREMVDIAISTSDDVVIRVEIDDEDEVIYTPTHLHLFLSQSKTELTIFVTPKGGEVKDAP